MLQHQLEDSIQNTEQEFLEYEDELSETSTRIQQNEEKQLDESFILDDQEPNFLNVQNMKAEYSKAKWILNEKYEIELSLIQQSKQNIQYSISQSSISEQSRYIIKEIFKQYIKCGKPRELFMERLLIQFPNIKRQVLDSESNLIENQIMVNKKEKAVKNDRERNLCNLNEAAEIAMKQLYDIVIQKIENDIEFLKQEVKKIKISEGLEEKMQNYETHQQILLQAKYEQELLQSEKEQHLLEQQTNYRAEQKQKSLINQNQKQINTKLQNIQKQKHNQLQQISKKKQLLENAPKIESIQNKEMRKIYQKVHDKEQNLRQQKQKADKLEQYISKLAPQVQADPQRLNQKTKSMINKQNVIYDKADKVNLYDIQGYTEEKLNQDMRYRLSTALMQAGLSNTVYGRDVILKAQSTIAPRPDMIGTLQ